MTPERRERLFNLIPLAIVDGHLIGKRLLPLLKKEFTDIAPISHVWLFINFGGYGGLINAYNEARNTDYKFNSWFRPNRKKAKV